MMNKPDAIQEYTRTLIGDMASGGGDRIDEIEAMEFDLPDDIPIAQD